MNLAYFLTLFLAYLHTSIFVWWVLKRFHICCRQITKAPANPKLHPYPCISRFSILQQTHMPVSGTKFRQPVLISGSYPRTYAHTYTTHQLHYATLHYLHACRPTDAHTYNAYNAYILSRSRGRVLNIAWFIFILLVTRREKVNTVYGMQFRRLAEF